MYCNIIHPFFKTHFRTTFIENFLKNSKPSWWPSRMSSPPLGWNASTTCRATSSFNPLSGRRPTFLMGVALHRPNSRWWKWVCVRVASPERRPASRERKSEREVIMKFLQAQFPFWLEAVLCVKWGQRTTQEVGRKSRRLLPDVGVNSLGMLETGLRFCGGFVWIFCCNDCLRNMDLSQGDLWGSLVTRDLGNTGLGWLLLDRLVRALLKHRLAASGGGLSKTGWHAHSRTTIRTPSENFFVFFAAKTCVFARSPL